MAAGDGLVTMTPTSVDVAGAGSSASINSDGGVDFTAATSLSLNGVFATSMDNYLVVIRHSAASGDPSIRMQLRVTGTDATGSNYTFQELYVASTTCSGGRVSNTTSCQVAVSSATQRSGDQIHIYGPGLAQPTAMRNVNIFGQSSAAISDNAATHSLSTAYDGFTLFPASSSITGNIVVFGYEE